MKTILSLIFIILLKPSFSQDIKLLMKEAENAGRSLNEASAFEIYSRIINLDSNNIEALIHLSGIQLARGIRSTDKKEKEIDFQQALQFAQKSVAINQKNSDALVALSLANQYLAGNSNDNKTMAQYFKAAIEALENACSINDNSGYAAYAKGHLNFEMLQLSGLKKSMLKNIYKVEFKGNIDSAIFYYEKSKSLLPYFVRNYLELAKAYNYNNQPGKAIETLKRLIKLPNRTVDDKDLKMEGEALLHSML